MLAFVLWLTTPMSATRVIPIISADAVAAAVVEFFLEPHNSEEVDRLLAEAGTDKTRILTAQIWLADMADFAEMNAVWDAWVPQGNCPARATGESKLATPDYKVEIIVVAAV